MTGSSLRALVSAALAAGLIAAVTPPVVAMPEALPAAQGNASGWTPFFDSGPLKGSAWADCVDPIVLTVDPRALPRREQRPARSAFAASVRKWAAQSGLRFTYGGVTPVNYDDTTYVISPVDGVTRPRHMYITVLTNAESTYLTDRVVGFAMPTEVAAENREIVQAEGAFRTDYVAGSPKREQIAVFMHELGHALGLGHSSSKRDIMYPIVDDQTTLGPGDIAGIKALTRPCTTTPAS